MNTQKLTIFLFTLCVLAIQPALAQSSVWKAEKNGRHIYLGGALHMLTKADYPLPGEFDLAYNNAQRVYFETDIERLKGPKAAVEMFQALQSKTGQTLHQSLKPETLRMLKTHFKDRKLSVKQFKNYSPSGLYFALNSMELQRQGLAGVGVDMHFAKRARLQNKATSKLETIDQHLSFLSKIAGGNNDKLIQNGLRDTKTMSSMVSLLKKIWRSGSRENYRTHIVDPYRQYYPTAYKVLLLERNNSWMPKIEAMFSTPEVEFVLVGAMHLIGPHGILQRLEAKGYVVEPL